jgi:hypothetical protein
VAGGVISPLAMSALVAGYMVGNEDTIADFYMFDIAADFAYNACCFVA